MSYVSVAAICNADRCSMERGGGGKAAGRGKTPLYALNCLQLHVVLEPRQAGATAIKLFKFGLLNIIIMQ